MVNRREFIQTAASAAAVSAFAPLAARAQGANERVRMGLVGCGTRGNQVMSAFGKAPGNVFVAACDVSRERLDQTVAKMTDAPMIDTYEDYRRILDRKDTPPTSLPV
jgi:predicted homoserine dehydrogenase-like protein